MIYTVTPNPALDLGGTIDKLTPNEKAYVHDETRFPGGNSINSARIIHKLGQPVIASGFLGGGIGEEVKNLLEGEGVRCQFIRIQGHTRIGVTVSNRKSHLQTRLSFAGPKIRRQEIKSLTHWLDGISTPALVLIGGSLPPNFSTSTLKKIIQSISKRKIPCVVDVPGKILSEIISSKPYLIKPNLIEFQELCGKKVTSIEQVTREARKLNPFVPFICISSVEGGALMVTQEKAWFGKIPPISIKTTVGAGDSMVGGMSAHLWSDRDHFITPKGKDDALKKGGELLKRGLAAAAATLVTPGTQLGELKKILYYYTKIQIREL